MATQSSICSQVHSTESGFTLLTGSLPIRAVNVPSTDEPLCSLAVGKVGARPVRGARGRSPRSGPRSRPVPLAQRYKPDRRSRPALAAGATCATGARRVPLDQRRGRTYFASSAEDRIRQCRSSRTPASTVAVCRTSNGNGPILKASNLAISGFRKPSSSQVTITEGKVRPRSMTPSRIFAAPNARSSAAEVSARRSTC